MNIDYVLIDCGLIHKYCIKIKDIATIENKTLYTVKIIKNLNKYDIEKSVNEITFKNKTERLTFKKVQTSKELKWMLDEFA